MAHTFLHRKRNSFHQKNSLLINLLHSNSLVWYDWQRIAVKPSLSNFSPCCCYCCRILYTVLLFTTEYAWPSLRTHKDSVKMKAVNKCWAALALLSALRGLANLIRNLWAYTGSIVFFFSVWTACVNMWHCANWNNFTTKPLVPFHYRNPALTLWHELCKIIRKRRRFGDKDLENKTMMWLKHIFITLGLAVQETYRKSIITTGTVKDFTHKRASTHTSTRQGKYPINLCSAHKAHVRMLYLNRDHTYS